MRAAAPIRGKKIVDFTHTGFGDGININDSPEEIKDTEATQIINYYLSNDGDLVSRAGVTATGTQATTTGGSNIYRFFQEIYEGAISTSKITLMQCGSSLYNADTGALIGTAGQLGTGAAPMSVARIMDSQHTGGATDVLVICTGVGGPYAFDGVSLYTFPTGPTTITNPRWVISLNNQLWFGGLSNQPNLVVCTDVGTPETEPSYDIFTTTYPVTGLGSVGEGVESAVVVGMTRGVTLITGYTPSSFTEQEVPSFDGCAAGRSMVSVDGFCYFIGNFGIYRFDGASFNEISRKVRPWILNDPNHQEFPMNGNRQLSWSVVWQRRIYFWYDSGNVGYPNVALVYDLDRGAWSIYQGLAFSGACQKDAPGDPTPPILIGVSVSVGQQYQLETYTNSSTFAISDAGANVITSCVSKFYKIGATVADKHLLRVYTELMLIAFNGLLTIATDYGASATALISFIQATQGAEWDVSLWDGTSPFASTGLAYFRIRTDVNLYGEAFAFGLQTATKLPPHRLQGFSGRISLYPRN